MDAERQIIGSLLIDPSRLDDMKLINAEMFGDSTLGTIFSVYEKADGKDVNILTIVPKIITSYRSEKQAQQYLVDLASEHDAGISDESCEEIIFKRYKARKVNEMLDRSFITPDTIDDFLNNLTNLADVFQRDDATDEISLSELTSLKGNYFNERNKIKYETGFGAIDKALGGIDDGDVTIIAARPSVGKSAFALQIGRKLALDGYKVGYFNLEMAKKQIYERAIASASGIDMTRIRLATDFLNDEKTKFDKGNEEMLKEKNFFIVTGTQSIKSIRAKQKKKNYDIIIIDYMQLIVSSGNRGGNRASEVGDISRGLKAIATDFNIPLIALSQLNRASEHSKDKEPNLSDLRESGDIEQDASNVLMMWNSNDDDKSEKMIKTEKSRNGFNDKIQLHFDGKHMRFEDPNEDKDFRDIREGEQLEWD